MKMYERFIPTPLTIEDFADHFVRNVGELDEVQHKKMFSGWLNGKYKLREIGEVLGSVDHSVVHWYQREHRDLMQVDELYKRKFESL